MKTMTAVLASTIVAASLYSSVAMANPLAAEAAATLLADSHDKQTIENDADAAAKAAGGRGGSSSTKTEGSVGAALGQAATALSVEGVCGKGTKLAFGALEWSDYSSKCFNYQLAIIAAQHGQWENANRWVERADGM